MGDSKTYIIVGDALGLFHDVTGRASEADSTRDVRAIIETATSQIDWSNVMNLKELRDFMAQAKVSSYTARVDDELQVVVIRATT